MPFVTLWGMTNISEQLVTLPQLAKNLKLPATWLRSETVADRIPHLRAGKRLLFNVEAVRQTLLKRAAEGVEDD